MVSAAAATLAAQTDPRITSWLVSPSRQYARIYESDAAKNAGTAVTTWSRAQGVQSVPSYAGVMQVSYSDNWVYLRSSGLGYHVMGPWYLDAAHTRNFPNFPANNNVLYRIPRSPTVPATKTSTRAGAIGYFVDGVAMFDYTDTFSYSTAGGADAQPVNTLRGDGIWNRDAYVNEGVTFDAAFAHQAGSNYHYHATTPALRHLLGDHVDYNASTKTYAESPATVTRHSPILAWASDGYPVYGPYGYSSPLVATSAVRRMISGYVKRDGANGTTNLAATGRTTLPAWATRAQNRAATLAPTQYGPAIGTANYTLGHYLEDYDYLGDLGKTQGADFDLDVYNGRFCVTPEFPNGTYAYFISIEPDGLPKFPYIIGRWFYGSPTGAAVTAISETVAEYVRGGQASAIAVTAVLVNGSVVLSWSSVEGGTYSVATSSDGTNFTTLANAVTSAGLTTTSTSATVAHTFKVTLTAVATYDTRGTGGLSGLGNNATATVGASGTARLVNIATRAQIGGTAGTPIAGFVIAGSGTKPMLVRAVGPGLTSFGVTGALADPSLSLVSGTSTIATNDNWLAADAGTFAAVGAFAFTVGSRDAALVSPLATGAYSTPVGAGGGSGVTLLEVYDADSAATPTAQLINASTRAFVGTGESVLIPGFVISGTGSVKLLIRAAGPALTPLGVTGALADPQITLYSGAAAIASNDNWSSASNAAEIAATATSVGAFAFGAGSRDAALLVTLSAGAYTASISGVGGTTGTALMEIYVAQ